MAGPWALCHAPEAFIGSAKGLVELQLLLRHCVKIHVGSKAYGTPEPMPCVHPPTPEEPFYDISNYDQCKDLS